jgi:DNA-binding XRE family transcriptional regulator
MQDLQKVQRVVSYTVSRYPGWSYGERIRQRRLELGRTQVDLAKLLSVSKMSVVRWGTGIRTLRPLGSQDASDHTSLLGIFPECVYITPCDPNSRAGFGRFPKMR